MHLALIDKVREMRLSPLSCIFLQISHIYFFLTFRQVYLHFLKYFIKYYLLYPDNTQWETKEHNAKIFLDERERMTSFLAHGWHLPFLPFLVYREISCDYIRSNSSIALSPFFFATQPLIIVFVVVYSSSMISVFFDVVYVGHSMYTIASGY